VNLVGGDERGRGFRREAFGQAERAGGCHGVPVPARGTRADRGSILPPDLGLAASGGPPVILEMRERGETPTSRSHTPRCAASRRIAVFQRT